MLGGAWGPETSEKKKHQKNGRKENDIILIGSFLELRQGDDQQCHYFLYLFELFGQLQISVRVSFAGLLAKTVIIASVLGLNALGTILPRLRMERRVEERTSRVLEGMETFF